MGKNIAGGNDRVAVQVGRVAKGSGSAKSSKTTKRGTDTTGETVNIRSGNARVGEQVDEIHGGMRI